MAEPHSKLELSEPCVAVHVAAAHEAVARIVSRAGCTPHLANEVADHLVEASLSGIDSHGIMRVLQYAEQMQQGYMRAGWRHDDLPWRRQSRDLAPDHGHVRSARLRRADRMPATEGR
jgi:hypothetical protein